MVTVNCDMGESFGPYRISGDAALMPLIDLVDII
jgi:lactam utilization protein B